VQIPVEALGLRRERDAKDVYQHLLQLLLALDLCLWFNGGSLEL
jgi:hypothetical protein